MTIGLIGIFLGDSTGVELLEFPKYAAAVLGLSYVLFAMWAVALFLKRPDDFTFSDEAGRAVVEKGGDPEHD